jgi:hypothetical protein
VTYYFFVGTHRRGVGGLLPQETERRGSHGQVSIKENKFC